MIMRDMHIPEKVLDQNEMITIAPGEGKKPVSPFAIEHLDELVFPREYGGEFMDNENKLTYNQRIKYELRNVDGRHRNTSRILFMAKKQIEKRVHGTANVMLRSNNKNKNLTAKNVKNSESLEEIFTNDEGYKDYNFTKQIRQSPAFWKSKRGDQIAMMSQLGPPTLFMTISFTETKNPELLALLHKYAGLGEISSEDAMKLPYAEKTRLIRNDPFTVVQYFEEQLKHIEKIIKSKDGPFGPNNVIDFYIRKEFQNRGSVHAHILIWLKDAPKLIV